jgi:hypothetical protein
MWVTVGGLAESQLRGFGRGELHQGVWIMYVARQHTGSPVALECDDVELAELEAVQPQAVRRDLLGVGGRLEGVAGDDGVADAVVGSRDS